MAEVLQVRHEVSQNFTGAGNSTKCTLNNTPSRIKSVTVGGTITTSYTLSENVVTLNATSGSAIVIVYDYWIGLPTVKGKDGMSAYEAALAGGLSNTITETTFYTSLANVGNKQDVITATGILKRNSNGTITGASAGTDYVVPTGNVSTANTLATARDIRVNLGSTTAASFNGSAAANPGVTGVLGVANGGTGASTVDTAPTNGSSRMVTSGGVFTALANQTHTANAIAGGTFGGGIAANASSVANLGTKQIRNIYAGTNDLVAGSSQLTAGDIYIVYE